MKRAVRRSTWLLAAALLFLPLAASAGENAWSEEVVRRILAERIDTHRKSVGIVVGWIDPERTAVVGYGKRSQSDGRAPDGDTVFEIGSVTKVFTATLLAEGVRRGELKLEDPVSQFLPPEVRVPTRNGKPITLYHLATHTSGLPRMPDNFAPADPENPYADYSVQRLYDYLSHHELARVPGERAEYSNLGVGLLGQVLALDAGSDYETLVASRITGPLGMKDTAIRLTPELRERLAPGHGPGLDPVANWDITALAGAGALRSTVNDLLRFLAANLTLRPTDLRPALDSAQQVREDFESPEMKIGLGWILRQGHDRTLHWHNGGTGGYHSFIGFDRGRRTGVVVLSNASNSIDDIGFHLLEPAFELVALKPPTQPIAMAPEAFDAYVGRYQLVPGFVLAVTREGGRFFVQATGQDKIEVFPESPTKFFARVVDAQISFGRDAEGKVDHLVLHQGGLDQKAARLDEQGAAEFGPGRSISLPEETLETYVGRYELQPDFIVTISREGSRLLAQATGQPAIEIFAESETRFFYKIVDARITFNVGEAGKVESLTLHQGGRDMPARRLE